MIRLFIMVGLLAMIAALSAFLAGNPGRVDLSIGAWRISSSFAMLAVVVAFWTLLITAAMWFLAAVRRHLPGRSPQAVAKKQARGLQLVNKSLVALAAGDHRTAHHLAGQAALLLPDQAVVHMIQAEAALHKGNHADARQHFAALEQSEDGRLLGLRGLLADARQTGRDQEALRLARVAFDENRKSPWVLETLFSLEVAAGNWQEATTALDLVAREKLLDAERLASHRGAILAAEAGEAALAGDLESARKTYQKVLKNRPAFTPAVLALVQIAQQQGARAKAEKQIFAAWAHRPAGALARAYKGLDVTESRADWVGRAEKLAAQNPSHMESDILLADAYLDAQQPERATLVLARLHQSQQHIDQRFWHLRLREATQLGQDTDAIEEALDHAPHHPAYICGSCHAPAQHWTPICAECGAFDALTPGGQAAAASDVQATVHSGAGAAPIMMLEKLGQTKYNNETLSNASADKINQRVSPARPLTVAQPNPNQPVSHPLGTEGDLSHADDREKSRRHGAEAAAQKPFNPADHLWED